jgi:hypothetical protein
MLPQHFTDIENIPGPFGCRRLGQYTIRLFDPLIFRAVNYSTFAHVVNGN